MKRTRYSAIRSLSPIGLAKAVPAAATGREKPAEVRRAADFADRDGELQEAA